jgi:hypothetical protein
MVRTCKKIGYARGTYSVQLIEDGAVVDVKRFPVDYAKAAELTGKEHEAIYAAVRKTRDAWIKNWIAAA